MNQLLTPILTLILVYGYPIVVGSIALGYMGFPMPQGAILLAAGSFTSNGTLNFPLLIMLVTLTAVIGDIIGYRLSKKFGYRLIKKTFLGKGLNKDRIKSLNSFLEKNGWWCVFSSRWLFTPLGLPVDIIAGIGKYSFKKYFSAVVLGEFLWAVIYISLGNFFGTNWNAVTDYIGNVPDVLTLIFVGALLIYLSSKMWKKTHKTK